MTTLTTHQQDLINQIITEFIQHNEVSERTKTKSLLGVDEIIDSLKRKKEEIENLSARESEILEHLVKGNLYKEIAAKLDISQETVRKHVYHIYKKLHVNNRVEAFHKYYGNSKNGG